MKDQFGRDITYLRISVTDRCNLRCTYCIPPEGASLCKHEDILSFEEIKSSVISAVSLGIKKIRLTGGEPLLRKNIEDLVQMLSKIDGVEDLALTTNGILLPKLAEKLARAGLHRVNISLDAINPARYASITNGGNIAEVLRGIDSALLANLKPVKLNCVVQSGYEKDAQDVKDFGIQKGLEVRFIKEMNFAEGNFGIVEKGAGGDCIRCNRIRLTSDGKIMPCLFSDIAIDIKKIGFKKAFISALEQKPEKGLPCKNKTFQKIGG